MQQSTTTTRFVQQKALAKHSTLATARRFHAAISHLDVGLVGFGVHRGTVTGADVCRTFKRAIHWQGVRRHLSTDHDPVFGAHRWMANLRILEIDKIKTVPYAPLSHPFVEQLIGTI